MLKVSGLRKSFGAKQVLTDVNIHVEAGQVLAFVGGNGSGKSTTLNIVTGILEADAGQIYINGLEKSPDVAFKKQYFYIPDTVDAFRNITGGSWLSFLMRLYEWTDEDALQANVKLFGLENDLDKRIGSYSYGMKHKLALIAAFTIRPQLLIMDEPMNGLDPNAVVAFKEALESYIAEGGAVIFSTHLLDIAENICTHISILQKGRIVLQDEMKNVTKDGSLERVFMESHDHEDN